MARVFKFREDILGTNIHTFMDVVNNRPNKEIFISGKKVKKNSMHVDDLIFIYINGNLEYSCRAACNGPYDNGVPGQTEICLKDIKRLDNLVKWSNHPELSNISGHAWTNLSQDQVNFIFSLQPAEIRMEIEEEEVVEDDVLVNEVLVNEVLEDDVLVDDVLVDDVSEDGEEFFGTLLQRHQIDDIRQHLVMCEMSQFRAAMGRRMREINQMSDRDILNQLFTTSCV